MTEAHTPDMPVSKLAHFHITFFATVMGLAGLSLALHQAELFFGWSHGLSIAALVATVADFVLISLLYLMKVLRFPGALRSEWNHPVKLAFFPAISISLLLIATAMRPVSMEAAKVFWIVGAILQGGLTLAVISGWISHRPFQPVHISPAWFIPAVGNIVAPVAGVSLGYIELSWLFFSAGVLFWLVLLTLVMNRLIFHDPLPARLLPTLVILIAPPAVGMLAWLQLNGGVIDPLARIFFYGAIVFAAIIAVQSPGFAKLPFALSWWALSFPVAALTIATFRYAALTTSVVHGWLAVCFLVILLLIVAGLVLRTLQATLRGEICQPE
jgi:tellurite resistance protein